MDIGLILNNKKPLNLKAALLIMFGICFPSLVPMPFVAPWFVILLVLGAGITMIGFTEGGDERGFLLNIFLTAFLVRIALAFFLHICTLDLIWNHGFFIADGWCYSDNGWTIATGLSRGLPLKEAFMRRLSISGTLHEYDYINGAVYLFFGKSPLTMLFLNCGIGVITALLMYKISNLIFGKKIARITFLLCSFWPSLLLWSTQNLKEPLTVFLIVLSFFAFLHCVKNFNPIAFVLTVLSLFALMKFRFPIGALVVCSMLACVFFSAYKNTKKNPFVIIASVAGLIIIFAWLYYALNSYIKMWTGEGVTSSKLFVLIDSYRNVRAYSNLAFLPNFSIVTPLALLAFLPLGLAAVLLAPFPWQLFSPSQIMAAPEMIAWYALFPFLVKGIIFSLKNRFKYAFPIFIYSCISLLMMGVLEGNIGTMFRHRAISLIFLLMFIAAGLSTHKNKNEA